MWFVIWFPRKKTSANTYMAVRRASVNDATSCAPMPMPCITNPSMVTENSLKMCENTVNVNIIFRHVIVTFTQRNIWHEHFFVFFINYFGGEHPPYTYVGLSINGTGPIRLNPIMSMMHPSNVTTLAGSTLSHNQPHHGAVNA